MSDRTDFGAMAEKIDYTRLEKKLEQLRQQEPPKKRKGIADVLAPVREKLIELHASGWTYPRLVEELNSAGGVDQARHPARIPGQRRSQRET